MCNARYEQNRPDSIVLGLIYIVLCRGAGDFLEILQPILGWTVGVLSRSQWSHQILFAQLHRVRLNNNGANLLLTGECFDVTALIFWMALYFIILTRLLIIINKYGSQFVKILTIYYVLITACREERG